jgi:hypothetical protein
MSWIVMLDSLTEHIAVVMSPRPRLKVSPSISSRPVAPAAEASPDSSRAADASSGDSSAAGATQAALRHAEKELEREQLRSSWLSEGNDLLRAALDAVERDRADLQAQLAELVHATTTPAPNARPAAGPNRAQRRKADRERHSST